MKHSFKCTKCGCEEGEPQHAPHSVGAHQAGHYAAHQTGGVVGILLGAIVTGAINVATGAYSHRWKCKKCGNTQR